MPGIADGSTMRNTVRSLPAPSPKLASRYISGTASSASSVLRMMSGSTMMDSVIAPDSSDSFQCSWVTKNSMPNRPYTMDGMPDRVSAVRRMSPTSLLPFFAYSTR